MSHDEVREAKARLRRQVRDALRRVGAGRCRDAGRAVAARLADLTAVRQARTVMAFLSLPTEIDTWPFIRWAWDRGKRVAVPRIEPAPSGEVRQRDMVAVLLEAAGVGSPAEHPGVRAGPFGILEAPGAAVVPPGELDVVVVPCQAVDRAGNRLGKGGGFYDRFLAGRDLAAVRVAIAMQEQVFDRVPVAEHDLRMDVIVTDAETLTFE